MRSPCLYLTPLNVPVFLIPRGERSSVARAQFPSLEDLLSQSAGYTDDSSFMLRHSSELDNLFKTTYYAL